MQIEILIKQIRKNKGITLQRLSILSGISATHINDIENNLKIPSLIVMILLSKSLKVNITETFEIRNKEDL